MTGSQKPVKFDVRKEIAEITTKPYAIIGIIVFLIFMCAVPVFFVILPFAIIFLVILYKLGEGNSAKALKIARAKLGGSESKLEIKEDMELASAMVLNDWGVVYLPSGKTAIEMAWGEIDSVEETGLGMLTFKAGSKKLNADLAIRRYIIITEALHEKLKGKCSFLIDPESGESEVIKRLRVEPKDWKKVKLRIDDSGVEYDGKSMRWDDMSSVREAEVTHLDSMNTVMLTFSNGRDSLVVGSNHVSDGTGLPNASAYDYLKLVASEKLSDRSLFLRDPASPNKRALDEFRRSQDAVKAGYAFAIKSGKFHVIEPYFKEMLKIVDKFNLQNEPRVQRYFHDYALLLQRTGREEEAQAMGARVTDKVSVVADISE